MLGLGNSLTSASYVGGLTNTYSLDFDGVDDYVAFSAETFTGQFTVAFWINGDLATNYTNIVTNDSGTNNVRVWSTNGVIRMKIDNINSATITGISDDTWTHCVFTRDGDDLVVGYKNGVQTGATTTTAGDYALTRIGHSSSSFPGKIDEVAIWNSALTSSEITAIYNSGTPIALDADSGNYSSSADLQGWWRMGDGTLDAFPLIADQVNATLGSELITNGDMELNSNWTTSGGINTAQSTTQKHGGIYSWTFEANSAYDVIRGDTYTTVTDAVYQYSIWVYPDDGTDIQVKRRTGGDSDVTLSTAALTQDQWNNITGTYTETAGGEEAYLHINSNNATSGVYYVDDVSVKEIQLEDLQGSNEGTNVGATIDTDLYGGDTPKIPRAVDNAPTARADMLGNGSASFDGSSDYIDTGEWFVPASADFSFSCWAYSDDWSGDNDNIIWYGDATSGGGKWTGIGLHGSKIVFSVDDNSVKRTAESGTLSGSGWKHIAGVRDVGSTIKLYVDGIEIASTTDDGNSITNSSVLNTYIGIGSNNGSVFESWDGNIAQVGIWQGALTQAQIQEVKEKSFAELSASDKTTLVSYWTLDESVTDSASHSWVYDKIGGITETLGAELIGDTSFTDASYWVIPSGSSGTLDVNTTNAGKLTAVNLHDTHFRKPDILEVDSTYKLQFTVDAYTDGNIRMISPYIGTNWNVALSVGVFTKYWVATNDDFSLYFDGYGDWTATDISVKKVSGNTGQLK